LKVWQTLTATDAGDYYGRCRRAKAITAGPLFLSEERDHPKSGLLNLRAGKKFRGS